MRYFYQWDCCSPDEERRFEFVIYLLCCENDLQVFCVAFMYLIFYNYIMFTVQKKDCKVSDMCAGLTNLKDYLVVLLQLPVLIFINISS